MLHLFAFRLATLDEPARGFRKTYMADATRLRADLLHGYDKIVTPTSKRSSNYSHAGVDVGVQLRFFKVESVRPAEGKMRLKIWLRTTWTDERLSWNPEEYGNVTKLHFLGSSISAPEESEIWLPDIQPYNVVEGIAKSLDAVMVIGQSNGSVFWSRPGILDTMCKFSGLVAFPFDKLSCAIEFGGWALSGAFQGVELLNGGFEFSSQEETSGTSYQEYDIERVTVSRVNYEYALTPSEPWPILKYRVYMRRSSAYYSILIILPTVLLCYLSFGSFFVDFDAGERLGYGITLLLAMEVSKVVVSSFVPICGELLWADVFTTVCSLFCVLALVESIIVLFLASRTQEYLLPRWFINLLRLGLGWSIKGSHRDIDPCAGAIYRAYAPSIELPSDDAQHGVDGQLPAPLKLRRGVGGQPLPVPGPLPQPRVPSAAELPVSSHGAAVDMARRLALYEKLFFKFDHEARGYIETDVVVRLVSFVLVEFEPSCFKRMVRGYSHKRDGRFVRKEFVHMCLELFSQKSLQYIDEVAANAVLAHDMLQKRFSMRWVRIAKDVDFISRLVVPSSFTVTLLLLAGIEFEDEYATNPGAMMFSGVPILSISLQDIFVSATPIFIGVLCLVGWLSMRRYAARIKLLHHRIKASEIKQRMSTSCRQLVGSENSCDGSLPALPVVKAVTTVGEDVEVSARRVITRRKMAKRLGLTEKRLNLPLTCQTRCSKLHLEKNQVQQQHAL